MCGKIAALGGLGRSLVKSDVGTYQQFHDFMNQVWAGDSCGAGTASIMQLPGKQEIKRWRRSGCGRTSVSTSQKWHMEGSTDGKSWSTICSSTSVTQDYQSCNGATVNYVKIVKDAGGGGPWNCPIELQGCAQAGSLCKASSKTSQTNNQQSDVGSYQQFNQWMSAVWACDTCGAGTKSTIKLD